MAGKLNMCYSLQKRDTPCAILNFLHFFPGLYQIQEFDYQLAVKSDVTKAQPTILLNIKLNQILNLQEG